MAVPKISPREAMRRMQAAEKVFFVDVRNSKDWAASDQRLPGALRTTLDDVHRHVGEFPGGATIVFYCT